MPILDSIHRKLAFWSGAKLSLAGRALVVNQVLLATTWYMASYGVFCKPMLHNYDGRFAIFFGLGMMRTDDTKAQVAWQTIIQPKSAGGLGIIDPEL